MVRGSGNQTSKSMAFECFRYLVTVIQIPTALLNSHPTTKYIAPKNGSLIKRYVQLQKIKNKKL